MGESTFGVFKLLKELSKQLVQGTMQCSCGGSLGGGGVLSLQRGSTRTLTCTRCKKKVTVNVPK